MAYKTIGIETPYELDSFSQNFIQGEITGELIKKYFEDLSGEIPGEVQDVKIAGLLKKDIFNGAMNIREPDVEVINTSIIGGAYSINPWTMLIGSDGILIYQFSTFLKNIGIQNTMELKEPISPLDLYEMYKNSKVQAQSFMLSNDLNSAARNFYGNVYSDIPSRICWGDTRKQGIDTFYSSLFNGDLGSSLNKKSTYSMKLDMRLSLDDNLRTVSLDPKSLYNNIATYVIISEVYRKMSATKIMDFTFYYQIGVY